MKENSISRSSDTIMLIENLCQVRMKDPFVHFNFTIVGARSDLYNIWWTYLERVEEYRNFGFISGVRIYRKAISIFYSLP